MAAAVGVRGTRSLWPCQAPCTPRGHPDKELPRPQEAEGGGASVSPSSTGHSSRTSLTVRGHHTLAETGLQLRAGYLGGDPGSPGWGVRREWQALRKGCHPLGSPDRRGC